MVNNPGGFVNKILIACCLVCGSTFAQLREWTFKTDGRIETSEGGSATFRKGGRVDAEFVKCDKRDGTNIVFLRLATGGKGWVWESSLSSNDVEFVQQFKSESKKISKERERALEAKDEKESNERRERAESDAKLRTRSDRLKQWTSGQQLTAKAVTHFPEQFDGKQGWIDCKFDKLSSSRFIGDFEVFEDELAFTVRDDSGWMDCIADKSKLGNILMRLQSGEEVRLAGKVSAPVNINTLSRVKPVLRVEQVVPLVEEVK
jgi:hypothetical protein